MNYYKKLTILLFLGLCNLNSQAQNSLKIEEVILKESKSFYHINFQKYNKTLKDLPIGVFDSGTGGLTVLDALINYDDFNNKTHTRGKDNELDFINERFIYLADQANMPYGNYNATGKDDLLKEHIIKDFQFLLSNKYYLAADQKKPKNNKQQVKAIVIACNTATAYGYEEAMLFLKKANLNIPVVGVINAASNGTLSFFDKKETGSIAVFATVGTIASNGYERTLRKLIHDGGFNPSIQIYNQGGYGLAEAVDEEADFKNSNLKHPSDNYRGPSLSNTNYPIEKTLLDVYNFNFDQNKMLCDTKNVDDCSLMQLNDSENYVRYHLVSLLEKMRKTPDAKPLKALILGCTHYPYLIKEIEQILDELKNYKSKEGSFVYNHLIADKVHIVDPSIYVAQELYIALSSQNLLNKNGSMHESEFYISVPNKLNMDVKLDDSGKFTYEYKYGRTEGNIQEYVKVVPFDKINISSETLLRFEKLIPNTYKLIKKFSNENIKLKNMQSNVRI